MASPAQIGYRGERIVVEWLESNGYTCVHDTKLPGSTDIEADSAQANILVQVKTAVSPCAPAEPSAEETRNIKARATRLKRTAWFAKVTIDDRGQLIGKIAWSQP